MSKLTLKVELIEVNAHTRKAIPGAVHETEIDADVIDAECLGESLLDNLSDIDSEARKSVAARRVDFDSFKSDSDYLDMIDRVAGDLYTVGVAVSGAVRKNYVVEGIYPNDGGLWCDEVSGVNASEAEFQAAWTMAENEGGTIETNIDPDTTPEQSIERIAGYISDQRIESSILSSPRKEEAMSALAKLCREARAFGLSGAALDEADALVAADRQATEAVKSDRIVYLDTEAPAVPSM